MAGKGGGYEKMFAGGGVDVSFEGWKCFKQQRRLNKGWRKNK